MNPQLYYVDNALYFEGIPLADIAAHYGSPCFVYSRMTLKQQWELFTDSLADYPYQICYAVKANSNLAILQTLAQLGSGFDIVSGGELQRVLTATGSAQGIVFSGAGKTAIEIEQALKAGIACFNIESEAELERIECIAQHHKLSAPIAIRVNPNIAVQTHPYIATGLHANKFGVSIDQAYALYRYAACSPALQIKGIACHLGSQLLNTAPIVQALEQLLIMHDQLRCESIFLDHINLGGGLGVRYHQEKPPTRQEYITALLEKLSGTGLRLIIEPGRSLVAHAGLLLTRVEYLKNREEKQFVIVDAGMNDFLRPALYQAWHDIKEVTIRSELLQQNYDVVGPVCESSDVLGIDRSLRIQAGDLLAITSCGAYGFCMSSNYNTRPRAAEVMVDGDYAYLIRARETIPELFASESLLPH